MFKRVLWRCFLLGLFSTASVAYSADATVSIYDQEDFGGYQRSLQFLRRDFADDVPFYLAVPNTGSIRGVVLLLHGITSSKDIWWQNEGPYSKLREYRSGLLEAGFVVVAPDARGHGQRSYMSGFDSPMKLLATQNWDGVRQLIEGSAHDFSGLIGHLKTLYPDVPLGVLGMSLGAMQTFFLAANDGRVDFAVPVFAPIQTTSPVLDDIQPMTLAANVEVPTLLLISDQDVWYSFEDGKALYQRVAAEDKQRLILSTPHELGYSEAEKVLAWITKRF